MYNRVFKNYQVNVGNPFQIKTADVLNAVRLVRPLDEKVENDPADGFVEGSDEVPHEDPEDLLAEAREEAEKIVNEARAEAEKILREAQEEIERIKIEAEEAARKKGYEDGINEGRQQYENLINEAEQIRDKAREDYDKAMAGIEEDAVELILAIAKKVICAEIKTDRGYIIGLLREAIEKCAHKEKIVLRVSDEDFDHVEAGREELMSMIEGLDELDIKKDLSLEEGSCVVETQYGSIDAGIHTKVAKIEEAFLQAVGK